MAEPTKSEVTQYTSNLPAYAQPYFQDLMDRAQAESKRGYVANPFEQFADFTPAQLELQKNYAGLTAPKQIADASGLVNVAGKGLLSAADYAPTQFTAQQIGLPQLEQYRMQAPREVEYTAQNAPQMGLAQTQYDPQLRMYQMSGPSSFNQQGTASQYMSPYMQQVVDIQKQEAMRDAQKGQLAQDLGSVRQGTYGGARQLLAATERERNLGTQLGQIQAAGSQAAYQQAQQQFNAEQGLQQQAGAQNLQANLGVQQLGAQTGVQTALANLSAAQQQQVQNQAAILQTQGLNAQQAMQAALANQQMSFNTSQQNLNAALGTQQLGVQTGMQGMMANQQANLEAQRNAEQSKQFGATNQINAFGAAAQTGQTLSNLGQTQQNLDLSRLGAQSGVAAQPQMQDQQQLDYDRAKWDAQQNYNWNQINNVSSVLRGVPVTPNQTVTGYGQQPSMASQLFGAGLGVYSTAKTFGG